jgi:hypothetical protein
VNLVFAVGQKASELDKMSLGAILLLWNWDTERNVRLTNAGIRME